VLFCVMCLICVLCLIVVPLPRGKNPFAVIIIIIIIFSPHEVSSVRDADIQREFERVEIQMQIQNSRD
jgi:hypothetical protein